MTDANNTASATASHRAFALEEAASELNDAVQVALFAAERVGFETDPGHVAGVLRSLARACERAVDAIQSEATTR